jgi:alpha-galactosidase
MWTHNVPRTADGRLPPPILHGNTSGQFHEMTRANEENQKHFIDRYVEERIGITFWWMDAGWYPCGGEWPRTGTWEVDRERFPNGLRAISDHARRFGIKTLVWFEPERVAGGTWLAENHPEWLLGPLLNLGHPKARQWLTDHVDRVLREQGIDLYRQDFNMDPLSHWRAADAPDRRGMTENLHVQGYLAWWDDLRRRHPDLVIDSCASGGRRNDLETMRRAIPLHPTDYHYADLPAKQAYHYSLCQWIPCYGSNTVPIDPVSAQAFRSGHGWSQTLGYDMRRGDLDYGLLRRLADEWRRIVGYYRGDFYPLTPYSRVRGQWMAWQFHRPEPGDGLVEAFRRAECGQATRALPLAALDADATYRLTVSGHDVRPGEPTEMAGRDLMKTGVRIEVPQKPGSCIITYEKVK